jgi:hypothetical protein
MFHRLVYRSSLVAPAADRRQELLAAILETSRRRNAAVGLTGALLHAGECLVQVLEGPLQPLEETYDRISADLRHANLVLLQFVPIAERGFPDWRMAYVPPDTLAAIWPDLARGATLTAEDIARMIAAVATAIPAPARREAA